MRILLVEDEENIRKVVKLNLEMDDYEVITTDNGKDAMKYFQEQHFDLIILDIMLPEISGLQICEQIRLTDTETPIIFLTAKDSPPDRVAGLKKGADDYLAKPFNLEELQLRIKKLISRSQKTPKLDIEYYEFGKNKVNFSTFDAKGVNGDITLTKKEAMLLKLLIERKNEVVSRQQILQFVWGYDVYPSTRTIDNFILSFRKYFEENPKEPQFFKSVRGIGYKFLEQ